MIEKNKNKNKLLINRTSHGSTFASFVGAGTLHRNRPVAPRTHRLWHFVCIPVRTNPQSEAQRRRFVSTATNAARWRPCWLHYDDWRLAVPIVNDYVGYCSSFAVLHQDNSPQSNAFTNPTRSTSQMASVWVEPTSKALVLS